MFAFLFRPGAFDIDHPNPSAIAMKVTDVLHWSREHRMLRRWLFLTGAPSRLRAVWRSYGVEAKVVHGDIDHTAIVFVTDPEGREEAAFPIATRSGVSSEAGSLAQSVRTVLAG